MPVTKSLVFGIQQSVNPIRSFFLKAGDHMAITGLTNEWFCRARKSGLGFPFMRVTTRIIRYERDVVLDWFRQHTQRIS